ncbi:HupE/UreJ family protein [Minwuia thermotolerans]|uniref:Ni/Fe hydrogenase n=1 Tax=Minwuia thermotolerans TaxID=2056226 RepID=A0A2M9G7L7_9PROT|nr:HupE/UreJ family protein [Minwuia thermotolerans]PJK31700.1 Ni/Fe hydrogenase [Minwuia thermotolerans]
MIRILSTAFALCLLAAAPALAHEGGGAGGGLVSGFLHPILGWDHVAAMVAVGLWGAFLGQPAIWQLPVVFPLVMVFGGILGIAGVPVPQVETGIAASALILGVLIALAAKPPLWMAWIVVGLFAIFHGHAHGTELPEATSAVTYSIGFVVGTGLMHLVGIGFGLLARWPEGRIAVRAGGGVIALAGLGFLTGTL